jgi:hypothetical protein
MRHDLGDRMLAWRLPLGVGDAQALGGLVRRKVGNGRRQELAKVHVFSLVRW